MKQKNTNKLIVMILLSIIFANCNSTIKINNDMENMTTQMTNNETTNDTIPKVTGIGGIFFFSDDPKETREWYGKNLGLEINDYGSTFEVRNANRPVGVDSKLFEKIFIKNKVFFFLYFIFMLVVRYVRKF